MSANPAPKHTDVTGSPETVRRGRVERLGCADLVDALGRLHQHRAHLLDLRTPTPGRILFGPAVTISFFPTCATRLDPEVHNFGTQFRAAVGEDSEGKVLVLATNGHPGLSTGGGTKLGRVHHYGLAGVLSDGRLRDFAELRTYDFATYCAGEALQAGGATITPYQANVPVVLHGVGILPGDYVFADDSGGVVIPAAEIDEVIAGAEAVQRDDAGFREQIARERSAGEGGVVTHEQ